MPLPDRPAPRRRLPAAPAPRKTEQGLRLPPPEVIAPRRPEPVLEPAVPDYLRAASVDPDRVRPVRRSRAEIAEHAARTAREMAAGGYIPVPPAPPRRDPLAVPDPYADNPRRIRDWGATEWQVETEIFEAVQEVREMALMTTTQAATWLSDRFGEPVSRRTVQSWGRRHSADLPRYGDPDGLAWWAPADLIRCKMRRDAHGTTAGTRPAPPAD